MVPSIRKQLTKSLSAHKIPSILQSLNKIAVQQEYDPIIDVGCKGSILIIVLLDGRAGVNVITIPAMKYCEAKPTTLKRPSPSDGFGDHICSIKLVVT